MRKSATSRRHSQYIKATDSMKLNDVVHESRKHGRRQQQRCLNAAAQLVQAEIHRPELGT